MRRIRMLLAAAAPEQKERISELEKGLLSLGWTAGRNLQIEYRWACGTAESMRQKAGELIALTPDVLLAPALGLSRRYCRQRAPCLRLCECRA
jgi:hypothetical protein